jgi:MOSC domain-containing protein YiiM
MRTIPELDTHLAEIRDAPRDEGELVLIVRRPTEGAREILDSAELDLGLGLVGDRWAARPRHKPDGTPDHDAQITLIGMRALRAIADEHEWALAGDNLYVDLDLSTANLPPGTQLDVGAAVLEVTGKPHNGCAKFLARFGSDALQWTLSPVGRELNLRGIHARVVRAGAIRRGDRIRRLR